MTNETTREEATKPITEDEAQEIVGGARMDNTTREEHDRQSYNRWYNRYGNRGSVRVR